MLFFHYFKSGRFGMFYGSVDPLVITSSIRQFLKIRNGLIEAEEKKEMEKKRDEWSKTSITHEEYLRMKNEKSKNILDSERQVNS